MPTLTPGRTPTPTLPPGGPIASVPILMYHYVRPEPGANDPIGQDLSVSPEHFAEQMAWLAAQGYTTLTISELEAARQGEIGLPPKPVVLTFDDGYRDFYTAAFPLLKRYGFKATVFVVTGFVDQPRYVTWDMLGEMDRSGLVEIGSHTVSHVELPSLSDAQATRELTESKQALERHLGHPVPSFCYPSGRVNDHTVALVKAAGYDIAVTTQFGWSKATQDSLLLPRVRIHGSETLAQFQAALK